MSAVKNDLKQVGIYVVGVVLMIVGWFLNDFMTSTDVSFANLYSKQDQEEMADVAHWKGEAFYYRDKYNVCRDEKANCN